MRGYHEQYKNSCDRLSQKLAQSAHLFAGLFLFRSLAGTRFLLPAIVFDKLVFDKLGFGVRSCDARHQGQAASLHSMDVVAGTRNRRSHYVTVPL